MALSKIDAANFLTGTIPQGNVANASLDAVTSLPAGVGGKVLQVVTATDSTERSTTSSTFVTVSNTLSVDITPSSTSSKIFIIANIGMHSSTTTGNSILTIYRDSTNLGNGNNGIAQLYCEGGSDIASSQALSILDTPSTTSEITYQIYVRANSSNAFINIFGSTSSITAFEIAG